MAAIVVLTGGGIKGAVAAAGSASDNEIILLHVHYGQRSASAEAEAARALAAALPSARVVTADMPHVIQISQAATRSRDVGRAATARRVGRLPSPRTAAMRGLVPVLASAAVQCALQAGAKRVVTGLSRFADADHIGLPSQEGQPDRLREFVHTFNIMVEVLSPARPAIMLEAPLIDATYADMVKLARHFQIPLERTWTCTEATGRPCGRCEGCKSRAAACVEAGVPDPLNDAVAT